MNAIDKALMIQDAFNAMGLNVRAKVTKDLFDLINELTVWSQQTFGSDEERDCRGPLEHLKKEIKEVESNPGDVTEWADMFLLYLDGLRRAGIGFPMLVEVAKRKLKYNQARQWNKAENGKVSEHVKTQADDKPEDCVIRLEPGRRDRRLGATNKHLIVKDGRAYMLVMPPLSTDDPRTTLDRLLANGCNIPYVE